ncbi:MAG: DMT family transporter [Ruminococcaceae bacterium]|nr:DMT family transporter [Oscillospiraceae bacterium]
MKSVLWAKLALLITAVIWGSSLVVIKGTVSSVPPLLLLSMRFTIACALLCIIFYRKLRLINKDYLKSGAVIGLCLFMGYYIQTIGVIFAMPGKSAFLSLVYCIIVPFLYWAMEKKRPNRYNLAAAVLCIGGIAFSSITSNFSVSKGDAFALASGLFFAAHIVSVQKCGKGKDPILITILQFGFCAMLSGLFCLVLEHSSEVQWTSEAQTGILYLSIMCTGVALLLQNIAQKQIDPSSSSFILSLQAVFGVLFSMALLHETLNTRLSIGFFLIFLSVIVSETKLCSIKRVTGFYKRKEE